LRIYSKKLARLKIALRINGVSSESPESLKPPSDKQLFDFLQAQPDLIQPVFLRRYRAMQSLLRNTCNKFNEYSIIGFQHQSLVNPYI